jgi:hypothetical protein
MPGRQANQLVPTAKKECVCSHEERIYLLPAERCENGVYVTVTAGIEWADSASDVGGRSLQGRYFGG